MNDGLTKKQRGFVKDYLKTGIGSLAVKENYDVSDDATARAMASENLTKPNIKKAIEDALPDDLLARVHLEGLNATKRSNVGGMKIGIGTDGKVNDFGHTDIDEPDYAVRHKYLDSAYKIKGSYAPEKSVNVNVEVEASPVIKELTDKLNGLYRGSSESSDGGITSVVDPKAQD